MSRNPGVFILEHRKPMRDKKEHMVGLYMDMERRQGNMVGLYIEEKRGMW